MHSTTHLKEVPDDKIIWQRFLAGEVEAFDHLMTLHFRTLFRYGSKFSRDKEFVKDNIQDLFLILWERRQNLSHDIAVKPYLMASLRRLMHRSAMSKPLLSDNSVEEINGNFEIEFSVEEEYIENESSLVVTQKLKKLLDELPLRQKEVVYLKYFQEMDRSQISEVMNISPQTVSNLLQIAIKQLKKHWKSELFIFFLIHFII
ncbi:RNA polymerase sigma factor [Dyadobacter frigoris]|uniref:Sigma-70 family RNA polymerase sigma factor n=1 Tax=Dyadobacter frigoris TaxID=2576211 RepID=A0A4U6DBU6_9BACT|nr:sigma-70 family RNA polymerase sigma factor [Dyadobacter frigoris]TKT91814.1 sigma-70 family RNA polymerase sigma factor [Dyadobacter frigoris]GLU53326.1 DNA-directed RNA polymerase sigma-70 factor [Dyadobacter frigoris]